MLNVKVTIGVGDPQGQMFEDLEVTVNASRTFTEVPRELLQRLGVPVERSVPANAPDGTIVHVAVGTITIRLEGLQFHTQVILGEDGEPSVLGMVTLEEALLTVDPETGRLVTATLRR